MTILKLTLFLLFALLPMLTAAAQTEYQSESGLLFRHRA